nr:ribonuclease H-like domain, reverse transcriptase, RNA-dependent DNA polymerase [Tanacetum cinerariifolium]
MDPGTKLVKAEDGNSVDATYYRSLIESLRYLLHTRPDLSYSVGLLSRFIQDPKDHHLKAIKQVIRYIKGTKEHVIIYKKEGSCKITTYSDSWEEERITLKVDNISAIALVRNPVFHERIIGAAKVSHFEINCRILNIAPTLNLFRVFYIPSFNSGWMSFIKRPGKNTPQCYTKPMDSLKNWKNRFFWVDENIFPTVVDWCTSTPKDGMPAANLYSATDVTSLDTHRTPIQKQPEVLLCLVGLNQRYFLGDDVYPIFLDDDDRAMDLFNLISALNPTKVKTRTRPRAAHEVPLLTVTTSRVIDMEDVAVALESSGTPSTIEKSSLDFANKYQPQIIIEGVKQKIKFRTKWHMKSC